MAVKKIEDEVIGADLLDELDQFAHTLLYLPGQEEYTSVILAGAVSHVTECLTAVMRVTVRGDSNVGKTTTVRFGLGISLNSWMSDATVAGTRSHFKRPGPHTVALNEASVVFGKDGRRGQNHPMRRILTEGFNKDATLTWSSGGEEQICSSYGVAWCAGQGTAVPEDVENRSIVIEQEAAPDSYELDDILDDDIQALLKDYGNSLHEWLSGHKAEIKEFYKNEVRKLHPKLRGRLREIWGGAFTIAHLAGGRWPGLVMDAFLKLGVDTSKMPKPTPGQQLVMDAAEAIYALDVGEVIFTKDLEGYLIDMDGRKYGDMSEQALHQFIARVIGHAQNIRGVDAQGNSGRGKGRYSAPILEKAAVLNGKFHPAPAEPEEEDDELEFIADPPEDDELAA